VGAASVRHRRRFPLVWLVPIVTALIAGWLAWDAFSKRGPTITVSFDTASGLTAGQSQLKYRNVVMGTVQSITIAPDLSKVLVTIETVKEAERLLTDKTIFWVVKPQLFAGNISGLETILSGSYIGMRPSSEPGVAKREYVGQEDPPILQASVKGTTFRLDSRRLGSISLGAPIFFRDIEVGTVLGWDLHDLASRVAIHAFVRAPYDRYVRNDSTVTPDLAGCAHLRAGGRFESVTLFTGLKGCWWPTQTRVEVSGVVGFVALPTLEASALVGIGFDWVKGSTASGLSDSQAP